MFTIERSKRSGSPEYATRRKARRNDRDPRRLLLEEWHAKGAAEHFLQLVRITVLGRWPSIDRLFELPAPAQVGMHQPSPASTMTTTGVACRYERYAQAENHIRWQIVFHPPGQVVSPPAQGSRGWLSRSCCTSSSCACSPRCRAARPRRRARSADSRCESHAGSRLKAG